MAKQLGELLIEQRFVTQSMLDQALALQQQRHLPLGKILLQLGYVTEDDLNTVLAKQFGSIYINLADSFYETRICLKLFRKKPRESFPVSP